MRSSNGYHHAREIVHITGQMTNPGLDVLGGQPRGDRVQDRIALRKLQQHVGEVAGPE
jgi:hypothetical protein